MGFNSQISDKIQTAASKIRAVLIDFSQKAKVFFTGLVKIITAALDRLFEKLPPEKRRFAVTASVSALALLVLIFSVSLIFSGGGKTSAGNAASGRGSPASGTANITPVPVIIPPDELFLPEEPDFLPGVLTQIRRRVWTAGDAGPFWKDPLKDGEQIWRDQIEKTIDDIMESVP